MASRLAANLEHEPQWRVRLRGLELLATNYPNHPATLVHAGRRGVLDQGDGQLTVRHPHMAHRKRPPARQLEPPTEQPAHYVSRLGVEHCANDLRRPVHPHLVVEPLVAELDVASPLAGGGPPRPVQRDPRVAGDEHAGHRAAALVLVALDAHPSVREVATDQVWHPEQRSVRLDVVQPHFLGRALPGPQALQRAPPTEQADQRQDGAVGRD